ncbi:hypothetical protein E2C01_002946 [Portunus trituberculatus]|uniref:Uncharacterized protein n=1 Tax=Portunus trituberculatus TaxID=210409 RepID=A0A5B7CKU6_PORTR|nr:hypothetical protein [Portunus trituberculatus]
MPHEARSWCFSNTVLILCQTLWLCLRLSVIYRGLSLALCFQDGGHLANHVSAFIRVCLCRCEGAKRKDGESANVSVLYFIIFYVFLDEIKDIHVFPWISKQFRNIMMHDNIGIIIFISLLV